MALAPHDHAPGTECVACATQTDIRALLFDLLQSARQGRRPAFTRVIVDTSALPDPSVVIDRLVPGKVPALGLRDHAVAKNFHLADIG
jgi:G3E family GTPase